MRRYKKATARVALDGSMKLAHDAVSTGIANWTHMANRS